MKRRRWWLVGFVAVAMLGWFVSSWRVESVASQRPASAQRPASTLPGARPTPAAGATGTAPLEPAPESVIEVMVTADGAPAPEVQLTLARQQPLSSAWRPSWDPPLLARTDARGRAEFAASTGTWVLLAVKQGFASAIVDVVKPAGERVTSIRVTLDRGSELRGLALDSKDAALAPATIRATPLGDRSTRRRSAPMGVVETTVDAKGAFQFSALSVGWWRLEGEAEGAGRAEPLLISVPTSETVKLRFRRSGFLEGLVVNADGGVAPGALVVIGSIEGVDSLEAGPTGTFSSERQPDSYRVSARLGELVGTAEAVALVRAGGTTSVRVVLSGRGGTLSGTVKRDDGVPVEGALVIVSPHDEDGLCGQANTASDGTWAIRGFPRGSYDLEAEAAGLMKSAERGFFVSEGADVHADLVLHRLGQVKGTVETATGAAVSARVKLRALKGAFTDRQAVSDGAGRFEFADVPAGPAFVTVSRSVEQLSRGTDVHVQAGVTSEVKVIFEEPVSLEVELDRSRCTPPPEVVLMATEPGHSQKRMHRVMPASTSRATFWLGPGEWQLMGWDANLESCTLTEGAKRVTLEGGKPAAPVRLVFGPSERAFEIKVLEADGQPAPFASVTARDDHAMVMAGSADADGVMRLSFPAEAVMTVTASKQGRSAQLKGVRQASGSVILTLRPAARLHLRLEGATATSRLTVMLDGQHFVDELRAAGSEVWLEEMPAGVLTVTAGSGDDTLMGRTQVVTSPGQTADATIRLQATGRVRGKVQQAPPGAWLSLTSTLARDVTGVSADGTFVLESVVAGDYVAKLECKQCIGWAAKSVSVAPGAQVDLQFP